MHFERMQRIPLAQYPRLVFPVLDGLCTGGLVAALAARMALKSTGLLTELPAPLVVLLCVGCATTFALWLVWLA